MTLGELAKIIEKNYPISADQVGMTYSEAYEELSLEHQKHHSLYDEIPDYHLIIKNAIVLLQQGSGHLLVLVSLSHAMAQLYKEEGMMTAVAFLESQLRKNWQELYPDLSRLNGRAQMLEWLIECFNKYFQKNPVNNVSLDLTVKLLVALRSLQDTLSDKFANTLSLITLIRPLEEQRQRLQKEANSREARQNLEEEKRQRQAEEIELQKQQNILQTLNAHAEAVSQDDYLAGMNTALLHALASKRLMRDKLETLKNNLFCYAIYKHNRAEMWWRYPMSSSELLNLIDEQGFDWQRYSETQKLKAGQRYEDALLGFEALSHDYPFYLPLQLDICDCLAELGAEQELINMLKAECQALCQQYPELGGAKINNELAVLNPNVRRFLSDPS